MENLSERNLIVVLPSVVAEWERAFDDRRRAVRDRQRALRSAERRLAAARGDLSELRWRLAADGRAGVRTIRDSRALNRALRQVSDVVRARGELDRVDAMTSASVSVADAALARATKRLLAYGVVAEHLAGLPARQLRLMAGEQSAPGQEVSPPYDWAASR